MDVLDNKCPSCGAKIDFNPVNQMWDCMYCGSKFSLEDMQKYKNASNDIYNQVNPSTKKNFDGLNDYHCKNCGAEIIADDTVTATKCVYCGSTAILKEKIDSGIAPNFIIPFKTTKEQASKSFTNLTRRKPLMPKAFKQVKNIENVSGIYIPFWAYDIVGDGHVVYSCTDISTMSDSTYRYTKTSRYETTIQGHFDFNKVLADGSSRFNDELMDSVEPFDYSELKEYNHAYLSGFLAEKYDISAEDAFKRACERTMNTCLALTKEESHHENNLVKNNNIQLVNRNVFYIMLPVWMVNINYKNKIYTFAVNGQTGKMVGKIPIGIKETIFWSLLIFIITFLIGYLIIVFK